MLLKKRTKRLTGGDVLRTYKEMTGERSGYLNIVKNLSLTPKNIIKLKGIVKFSFKVSMSISFKFKNGACPDFSGTLKNSTHFPRKRSIKARH
jgi:hypothetical protein